MGLAAAGTVFTAVLVALTLLPAMLGFVGARVLPRKLRRPGSRPVAEPEDGVGFRWARFVIRARVPIIVVLIVGLGVLSLPLRDLRLALPEQQHRRGRVASADRLRPDRRVLRAGRERAAADRGSAVRAGTPCRR